MSDFSGLLGSIGDWFGSANTRFGALLQPELTSVNQFMPAAYQMRAGMPTNPMGPSSGLMGNLGLSLLQAAQPQVQPMNLQQAPSAGAVRGNFVPWENFLKLWHSKGQTYGY